MPIASQPSSWSPYPTNTVYSDSARNNSPSHNSERIPSKGGSTIRLGIIETPTNHSSASSRPSSDLGTRIERTIWRYNKSNNITLRWILEILSLILSAVCMTLLVAMLMSLDNKRLPKMPLGITLNAYIAILSKTASAALILPVSEALGQLKWDRFQRNRRGNKILDFELFDEASRGPWGSFLLLFRTKFRALAALGAAVILLSLALDPFFQQIVSYPSYWTAQGIGEIQRAVQYHPSSLERFRVNIAALYPDSNLGAVARKFFYENGTQPVPFGRGVRAEVPVSCSSNNCTWPVYDTLGICSACTTVSELLSYACLEDKLDWLSNITRTSMRDSTSGELLNGTMCGYFINATSSSPVLMAGDALDSTNTSVTDTLLMRILPINKGFTDRLYGGSYKYKHIRNPILDFIVSSVANGSEHVYKNETPMAHECVLYWCVKQIKSSYFEGEYSEEETGTPFFNTTPGPWPWGQSQRVIGDATNGTMVYYLQNVTVQAPSYRHDNRDYGVSNQTMASTMILFDSFVPSWTTVNTSLPVPFQRSPIIGNDLTKYETNYWTASNNVTAFVGRLATAMSNVVRSNTKTETVSGTAYSEETFVSVRWEWMSLPLSLLLFSTIFLVSTIIKSSRHVHEVGVWKTSAIATLLYGLPDDLQRRMVDSVQASRRATLKTRAREIRIMWLKKRGRASSATWPADAKAKRRVTSIARFPL